MGQQHQERGVKNVNRGVSQDTHHAIEQGRMSPLSECATPMLFRKPRFSVTTKFRAYVLAFNEPATF